MDLKTEVPIPDDRAVNQDLRIGLAEDRLNDLDARFQLLLDKLTARLQKLVTFLYGVLCGLLLGYAILG